MVGSTTLKGIVLGCVRKPAKYEPVGELANGFCFKSLLEFLP